jgi:hypothetical protein
MNIIDYLIKSTNKEIKENIATKIMEISQLCEDKIGEGFFGRVYTPVISPVATVAINDKVSVKFPIVIKESKHTDGRFYVLNRKKRMYLYSDRELTAETIILFFISKFWYNASFPYGPFLVSIHWCGDNTDILVDKFVTERHGYYETIETEHTGINLITEFSSNFSKLETIGVLLEEALNKCDNNYNVMFRLYNKEIKFNLIELVDYIVLHFLIAVDYCDNKDLILTDQHPNNIFVSWIASGRVDVGSKHMSNVTDIYYKFDDVIIKAPLKNILIKLGDIGSSVLKLKKDLWIMGDVINEKDVGHIEKYFSKYVPSYMTFLSGLHDILPHKVFFQSSLHNIYDDKHIGKYTPLTGYVDPHNFPSPRDLLQKYFTKYIVKKLPTDSESVFLIK